MKVSTLLTRGATTLRGRARPWMVLAVTFALPAALAWSTFPVRKSPALAPSLRTASIATSADTLQDRTRS
ncbi:hypothetical protein D3C87_1812570 [compost metagenome]